jgi:hypothetical protein
LVNEPASLLNPNALPDALVKPYTVAGFGQWFKDRRREVEGLDSRASAHGLREAGAVFAAEAGATTEMLKAMYGWTSSAMADVYVKAANHKKLAALGMQLLSTPSTPLLDGSRVGYS